MRPAEALPHRRDYLLLAAISAVVSAAALIFYFQQNTLLLYGDAVAHINIARRVFDSRTPGLFQLGTVWLPLPHLLDIPFIMNNWLWRTGVGAAIPSMAAYVAGTLGIFRLIRGLASRTAAWMGALLFALNPNLLYMQATAMTEALSLALLIWTVVHFAEFVRHTDDPARARQSLARRSLERCAITIAAAMLVRYDAWFLGCCALAALGIVLWQRRIRSAAIWRGAVNCLLLIVLTAGVWLAYNHAAYGRALEFAVGPYSARAIAVRSRTPSMPTNPGEDSPRTATLYYLKAAKLNMGERHWGTLLLVIACVSLVAAIYFSRQRLPWLLLWSPLAFYILNIAWNGTPVFIPEWWPYSYYNVRYGLQLLPAMAVFIALAYEFLTAFFPARAAALAFVILAGTSYASVWQKGPLCLREAQANGATRMHLEEQLAAVLRKLPDGAIVLMDCGAHSGAIQSAGLPFRQVIRESNPPEWQISLADPAKSVDYAIAFENDEVFHAVRLFPRGLELVSIIHVRGQQQAFLYRASR
jgi:hypothetical protein